MYKRSKMENNMFQMTSFLNRGEEAVTPRLEAYAIGGFCGLVERKVYM